MGESPGPLASLQPRGIAVAGARALQKAYPSDAQRCRSGARQILHQLEDEAAVQRRSWLSRRRHPPQCEAHVLPSGFPGWQRLQMGMVRRWSIRMAHVRHGSPVPHRSSVGQ
ncbi:unnamed protein product, partial [Nesidiocoris tenuis]